MTKQALIRRLRAALRLIDWADITPAGKRQLEKILDAEDRPEDTPELRVIRTIGDLSGLPLGTRIATNHNKLLVLDTFAGSPWWFEEAGLQPYTPLVDWLPVIVLPPVVDRTDPPPPPATGTVCELRVEDDDD